MENFINQIKSIIRESKNVNDTSLYCLLAHSSISNGDESSITFYSWTRNRPYPSSTEELDGFTRTDDDQDTALFQKLMELKDPNLRPETNEKHPFAQNYYGTCGDFMRLQFTDDSIILTIIYSGQY